MYQGPANKMDQQYGFYHNECNIDKHFCYAVKQKRLTILFKL
ncbi:MAG: hypothetical protein Barrevirus1_53 [Barrevirus sp.]|uniref:Uncharacterized protein n=1 Tax=Barrevirus sp. TaxID=2487763 RepID=A0A3G4ZS51_9VIRU|nr:MAG: hypothetical protein Barrevirus1_53 [Barrevirus sp.]